MFCLRSRLRVAALFIACLEGLLMAGVYPVLWAVW